MFQKSAFVFAYTGNNGLAPFACMFFMQIAIAKK